MAVRGKGHVSQLVCDDVPQHHRKVLPGNLAQVLDPLLKNGGAYAKLRVR